MNVAGCLREHGFAVLPVPHFVTVDNEGEMNFEWCFGKQGTPDSWRVSAFIPRGGKGTWTLLTTKHPLSLAWSLDGVEGTRAADPWVVLGRLLAHAKDANEAEPSRAWVEGFA